MLFSHLAKFHGVYRSPEQPASLVSEYGSKGSLRDLLEDNDTSKFNLTWEMKKCLMLDVANGLNGLHKSVIKYHGFLKSSNCIVDGRLTVKIADFGHGFINLAFVNKSTKWYNSSTRNTKTLKTKHTQNFNINASSPTG